MADYNGFKNRATWNVALWLGNDESLYNMSLEFKSYRRLAQALNDMGSFKTPDGVSWTDPSLDYKALNEMLADYKG
jgi:hypothetical protein